MPCRRGQSGLFSQPTTRAVGCRLCCAISACLFANSSWAAIEVSPKSVRLDYPEATSQLLVTAVGGEPSRVDLTRLASYSSTDSKIATVDEAGLVAPVGEGKAEILVRHGTEEVRVPVEIVGQLKPEPISFQHQIIPLLTKSGCNAGGCHGKAEGQNGFKLSVFGFDTAADFDALVKQGRGRRVFAAAPERSLLLRKATSEEPHGGGQRIAPGGLRYRQLQRWIGEGCRFDAGDVVPVVKIEIEPEQQTLLASGSQQLRVVAVDAEGRRQCVTTAAEFASNAATIAGVDDRGLVEASDIPGEAAILVRYLGHVAVCRITIPRPGVKVTRPPEINFIDRLVWNKLERLGIEPSDLADDAAFLRRVSLDMIGTLPTSDEARTFLADKSADKRARTIDRLLDRPEYADYWTMKWSDILRVDKDKVTPEGAVAMTRWLRRQFVENRPYDQFARELLTVKGPLSAEGPAPFYKVLNTPEIIARSVSQVFLGIRIECAQCHHHPAERWSQDDYFAFAGFFSGIGFKPLPDRGGSSGKKRLPGSSEALVWKVGTDLKHPRTGVLVPTRGLGAEPQEFAPSVDRRPALAQWMTAPENPYFAPAIANRLWAHYLGRGLVESIDDMRATNPASNEPLLAALAKQLIDVKYDLKAFTRTLLNSRVYQLSSHTLPSNADDEQNFSHAARKPLPAEVLLDAICQVTGVPEEFNGWPSGYRSIQVWDNRMPSYFFRVFGRPVRFSVCECERGNEPSISQALHLLNAPELREKLESRHGVARKLSEGELGPDAIIDELYLSTLSRLPQDEERNLLRQAFQVTGSQVTESQRRLAVEDILWALVNSKEFIYNH